MFEAREDMIYEVRAWYDGFGCLYTDDMRVKDLAVRSHDLRITASYYRSARDTRAFAWDIVGSRERVSEIAARFAKRGVLASV
jgi:hypothetical protein